MVLSKDVKIAICFGLIMGAIISICNLCFAAEDLSFVELNGYDIDNGYIHENTHLYSIGYVDLEPGYSYTFTPVNKSRLVGFSNSLDAGTNLNDFQQISLGNSYTFSVGSIGYKFFVSQQGVGASPGTLTREPLQGLPDFVDNISYSLSLINLNNIVDNIVPILAIGVLFGLGFYFIKCILNKFKKAKGGI